MTSQLARRRSIYTLVALAIVAVASTLIFTSVSASDNNRSNGHVYKVTVTNITKGQIISPAVVATHSNRLDPIFTLGSPASDELAQVAEDAVLDPLIAALEGDRNVASVETLFGAGGPILPGETASVRIQSNGRAKEISLAAMLVTTNDVFMALNGVDLPQGRGSETHYSPGYDAGSEANNEDCAFIPGPPCGNPGVRDTDGAEGYVYISPGVHGIADLVPAEHDWRNPVAKIVVERVNGSDRDDDDDEDEDDD